MVSAFDQGCFYQFNKGLFGTFSSTSSCTLQIPAFAENPDGLEISFPVIQAVNPTDRVRITVIIDREYPELESRRSRIFVKIR